MKLKSIHDFINESKEESEYYAFLNKFGGKVDYSGNKLHGVDSRKKNNLVVIQFDSAENFNKAKTAFKNLSSSVTDRLSSFDSTENRIILYRSGVNESNSKFTLKVTTHNKLTGTYPFDTKPEAEAKKKELIKKHELTKQKGFYGNAKTGIELDQNY